MRPVTKKYVSAAANWFDDRVAGSPSGQRWLNAVFPDHWSFLLGEIALYCFVWLLISGVFLSFYYVPSQHLVVYHGSYKPLDGLRINEAYNSIINLSFHVRFGLLMRQTHHWAALMFIAAIVVHQARVFFTGAFRRPRTLNWVLGVTLLLFCFFEGYLGDSLTSDIYSGTGTIIGYSILVSIPFFGSQLAYLLWGGPYPGTVYLERFWFLHVFVLGGLITVLIGVHLWLTMRARHTQFRQHGAREDNVVGSPLWPTYAAKSLGFMFLVFAVIAFCGALFQVEPSWWWGPYGPVNSSDAVQPDWYIGILEGALRLFPNWEMHLPGHMIAEQFWPGVAFPGLTWSFMWAYPWLERRLTRDRRPHNILDRPRDRPVRTAFGLAFVTMYIVLFLAAGDDVLSKWLRVPIEDTVWYFRVGQFAMPAIVFLIAYRICIELQRKPPTTVIDHNLVITRRKDGSYVEVPEVEVVGVSGKRTEPYPVRAAGPHAYAPERARPGGKDGARDGRAPRS